MVWCNHCGKNVSGIRPYDGALACDLCGRILENFNFSTEINFANNAAGQNMPPPPATAMEAVQRMLDRKGLGRFIDYNVLEEIFATRPAEESSKRLTTETVTGKKKEERRNKHEDGDEAEEDQEVSHMT